MFGVSKILLTLQSQILDVAQLVAHLVRDQEVEGSSPFIQTKPANCRLFSFSHSDFLIFSLYLVGSFNQLYYLRWRETITL